MIARFEISKAWEETHHGIRSNHRAAATTDSVLVAVRTAREMQAENPAARVAVIESTDRHRQFEWRVESMDRPTLETLTSALGFDPGRWPLTDDLRQLVAVRLHAGENPR